MQNQNLFGGAYMGGGGSGLIFPEAVPWSLPPVHSFSSDPVCHPDPFLDLPPPPYHSYHSYGSNYTTNLFNNRRSPHQSLPYCSSPYDDVGGHLRFISESVLSQVIQPGSGSGSDRFGLQAELGKMSAQEIMDAKALAASKSHSEAERRRRERINNHLARLRSLLPSTTKTDKASLLAEVIQHVKELKRQTSAIAESSPVPTEMDELTVDGADEDGKFVIRASLCCEDRSDLMPELIKTLKAMRLRAMKAEITTLGGRVKNVLFITGEDDPGDQQQYCSLSSLQEALRAVMEKSTSGGGDHNENNSSSVAAASVKRQRTANMNTVLEHRSL